MRTLVILPTYNEAQNLPDLVDGLLDVDQSLDVLVIDDSSPDGTGQVAGRLAAATQRVRVLRRLAKLGLGTAYVAGFRYALRYAYDRVVQMDADLSHSPRDVPVLLAAAQDADVVIGSRNIRQGEVEGWPLLRHLISRGGSAYARLLLGLPIKDCTSGFKCIRREALERIDLDALQAQGFAFQVEVNYACVRAGLRLAEVPIHFRDRVFGRSKMSWPIFLEACLLVPRLRLGLAPAAIRTEIREVSGVGHERHS